MLLGLATVRVQTVERDEETMTVMVSTPWQLTGCPDCGVVDPRRGRRRRVLHEAPHGDARVRLVWRQRLSRCPEVSCPCGTLAEQIPDLVAARGSIYGSRDAQVFQHAVAGSSQEVRLTASDGTRVWADGVRYNPHSGGVAVEAKFIDNPGGSSIYEGSAPQLIIDKAFKGDYGLDSELFRYAKVIADPSNPVQRLDVVVSTDAARSYLGSYVDTFAQGLGEQGLVLPFTIRVVP